VSIDALNTSITIFPSKHPKKLFVGRRSLPNPTQKCHVPLFSNHPRTYCDPLRINGMNNEEIGG
jgi:hypothetical protein